MSRLLVMVMAVAATALAACGGDAVEEDEPTLNPEIPLNQVLERPDSFRAVTIDGLARPVGELGFILSQASASVFVDAEAEIARRIEDGEQVQVTAHVRRLDHGTAAAVKRLAETGPDPGDGVDERAIADTRIRADAPYLDLIHMRDGDA